MEASVCIATFRRPEGLVRLLRSLEGQKGDVPPFEVVIVDNDAAGSAASICEGFKNRLALRYLAEPQRGIAGCRNRAVAASEGRFLAFIDDDEEATPDWLAALHGEIERSGADAAFGPVTYRFAVEPPDWFRKCGIFAYPEFASGEAVPRFLTRTSNAYVRRASLPDPRSPFDASLGLIGGEDIDLFYRMAEKGARFVAAAEAGTIEYCGPSRATLGWLVRRSFRNGGTLARIEWSNEPWYVRLDHGWRAWFESLSSMLQAVGYLGRSRAMALKRATYSIECLGRAAWTVGIVYEEYRRRA